MSRITKLLKPIYDLTQKGKPFLGEKEQQEAFEEIKRRMLKPPVLSMSDRKGRFILYSDTSKIATGSTLYQHQDGKPTLTAYASKRMPEAAKNYSITELEMFGLAINIATFSHLLKRGDFDAVVDHLAIRHIMKSKMEPVTNRIKRLLEVLSSYSFNLYYIKGKDMVLSDYLSRQMGEKLDPHQVIPISFNINEVSLKPCQDKAQNMFMVQTRSQAKGVKSLPKSKSTSFTCKKVHDIKPIIIEDDDDQVISNQKKDKVSTSRDVTSHIKPPNIPNQVYPLPIVRLFPRPPDPLVSNPNVTAEIETNLDFEENSPHQEGIITETYESPDKSYLEQSQELSDLMDSTKVIHKYLPKQVDINKILNIIKTKVLKGTHLPLTIKEIQAGYLSSSFSRTYLCTWHTISCQKCHMQGLNLITKLCLARSVIV